MSPRLRLCAGLLAVALGVAPAATAREIYRDGDRSLDFAGSVRQIVTHTNATGAKAFGDALASDPRCALAATFARCAAWDTVGEKAATEGLTRLRLGLEAVASPSISARVVWDNELRYGTLDRFFAPARVEDTFFEAESAVIDATDHFSWVTRLYRGYLRYQGEHAQLTVGRQRLAWGVGRLWNPLDRFSFVPPLAIEADQSLGIDSIDARWRFNGFDYVQAVYAPGNSSSEARYALRYQAVVRDVDVSALTGVFGEAFVAGFDLAGNLADAAVRLEVAYTDPGQDVWPIGAATPSEPDPFWQVVVSGDYNFDLGSGLYVLVEHLYNGNALGFGSGQAGALLPLFGSSAIPPPGVPPAVRGPFVAAASPAAFGSSLVVSGSRHLTGVQGSYEFSGVLRTDLLVIWDWDGSSAVFAPSVAYLGWNEVELTLGAQLFAGPERSEYGSREPLVFLVAEFFF